MINDAQRASLLQTLNTDGYKVILDLGNDECEILVTELLSVDSDREKIIAKHNGARYARLFFDRLCRRIEREAKSILKPEQTKPLPPDFVPEADLFEKSELPADFIPEEFSGKKGPVITG